MQSHCAAAAAGRPNPPRRRIHQRVRGAASDIGPQSPIRFRLLADRGGEAIKAPGQNVQLTSREFREPFVRPATGRMSQPLSCMDNGASAKAALQREQAAADLRASPQMLRISRSRAEVNSHSTSEFHFRVEGEGAFVGKLPFQFGRAIRGHLLRSFLVRRGFHESHDLISGGGTFPPRRLTCGRLMQSAGVRQSLFRGSKL